MSILVDKQDEKHNIVVKLQIQGDDLVELINKGKNYFDKITSKETKNKNEDKSFINNFLLTLKSASKSFDIKKYILDSNVVKDIAYSKLTSWEKENVLWNPIINDSNQTISDKFISLEFIFFKKPNISLSNDYKNINFSLDENQSILLETSGEIFGEIVNGNFYKIVSKNIFDNKKYHAIFTWGFVDKNGRVIKGQIENPCETFFPFQILKIHFPNFKDNLIGMKKGEIKIINLGNHKLVNEEGQEGSNIYIHLHEFIEIDWNRYYKEKGYPKFEKFADFFEWRINKQQKKNTEYNFVKDSYNVFKCIVEDCISFSEYENKLISSISAKLSYNYMKKMDDNKFDEYVWLVSSFAELDEDIMTKDNYIQTNNVGSMKEIFHFLFQLNLLELSWDSIFKEEKVEIKDIEWKSLALKKLHDDLEGKFTTYLYCSNETIFIEKQQLEQERLSEIEQFYLDSLTKIDILNFKFKAKKLKALKKIIFSKL